MGIVVFAQAIGAVIASVVEYGFDISASRQTSQHRHEPQTLSELISGVLGAKSLLAVLCLAGALFSRRFTHHIAPSSALFWASTIWGVCQGINMLWFFQGLERMRLASALEIGSKVLATLSIFVLVHHPDDGWKVMASQCVGCVVAHGVTVVLAYREVGFRWPTPVSVWNALRWADRCSCFERCTGFPVRSMDSSLVLSRRLPRLVSTRGRNGSHECFSRGCGQ
jgi:PST family polysaccharide transporter